MAGGWFDPNAVNWFDESASQGGWFDETLQDASFGGGGGGGTVTFVQSAHGEAGSGVSPTATFSSNVTSGNLLVIVANAYRAGTPPHAFSLGDLTKSSGTATLGTAQLDIQHARANGTSSEERTAIWSIPVTGTGSLTLSLAVNAGDYANIAAAEFSGADTSSSRLDTSLSNDAAGPGIGALLQIGNMTSAGAGVFVGGITAYTSVTTTWTPDGAFSTIWNEGNVAYNGSAAIYQIVASATTDSVDATLSAFDTPGWTGAAVIYKAGSGGGGTSYDVTISESVTASDALATALTAAASVTEGVTVTDLWANVGQLVAALSEAAVAADALTSIATLGAAVSEPVTASDSPSGGSFFADAVTEPATASDAKTGSLVALNTLAEAITAADAPSSTATLNNALSETITPSDSYAADLSTPPTPGSGSSRWFRMHKGRA